MAKKKTKKLTPKESLWVKYYLSNFFNATDAARKSGYKDPFTSGYKNTKKDHIQAACKNTIENLIKKSDDKIAAIIKSLQLRSFYDIKDILDPDGDLIKPLKKMGELSLVIDGIDKKPEKGGGYIVIYKLANKEKNKEMLGRYLQMFAQRIELTAKDGADLPPVNVILPSGKFE